ncbi:hypothetical protein [Pseudomonas sp. SCB32]|uniref:hypothetical protein n=1 Tax=Pseudomonas sp. SCB32 TaxID=2653853 RepID=UPI001264A5B3|nr:hypothetical protein [Pseudomonas sp. SCB32]
MSNGMKVGLGRPDSSSCVLCVSPQSIQNIRNIKNKEEKLKTNQQLTYRKPFHQLGNKQKQAGTISGTQVPEMFRNSGLFVKRCSPSATWAAATHLENPFRLLPVAQEQFQAAGGPVIQGLQQCAGALVPDVPDSRWAYAGFSLSAPLDHLAASHLDTEVFQVLVGLLANYDNALSN